jgi:hypothetical protein
MQHSKAFTAKARAEEYRRMWNVYMNDPRPGSVQKAGEYWVAYQRELKQPC